jgi:predicted nucleic acid-binding protein
MAAAALPSGLIDTDILIDAQRGVKPAIAFLSAQRSIAPRKRNRVSVITAMELIAGCHDKREMEIVKQFLGTVRIMTVDDRTSRIALDLVERHSLGDGMEIPDALIAATALRYGWPLYTRNLRHYRSLEGLTSIAPY